MSVRVSDPSGVEWTVSRDWFGLPRWTRFRGDWSLSDPPLVGYCGDELAGTLALVLLEVVLIVLLIVLVWVFIPVAALLAGLLVAILALATRLSSISAWTVHARTGDRALSWRIRGTLRSKRAMRDVAAQLARGEKPTIDGIEGALAAD